MPHNVGSFAHQHLSVCCNLGKELIFCGYPTSFIHCEVDSWQLAAKESFRDNVLRARTTEDEITNIALYGGPVSVPARKAVRHDYNDIGPVGTHFI